MKTKLKLVVLVPLLLMLSLSAFGQGTAFTYQGRLNVTTNAANGSYDLTFALFNAGSGPSQIGGTLTNTATSVSNGLFLVTLNFGGVFNGTNYWLEIGVRTNGNGAFTTLAPRQAVTPTPYAIYAEGASNVLGTISASQISGTVGNSQLASNSITVSLGSGLGGGGVVALGGKVALTNTGVLSVTGSGVTVTPTNGNVVISAPLGGDLSGTPATATVIRLQSKAVAATVPTIGQVLLYNGSQWSPQTVLPWLQGGNSGTVPGVNFVGTVDNQPFELKVNSQRAIRLEPGTNGAPNVIGGASVNYAVSGVNGAVIGGGGASNYYGLASYTNSAGADFGMIGGGLGNTIQAASVVSTIGGGALNTIQNNSSDSTISGGQLNTIRPNASNATIGGGAFNTNGGNNAVVPGGYLNFASGDYSFAAGNRAKAVHPGAFVWADSQAADFNSTTSDQFAVRAQGGVNLVTTGAGLTLDGQPVRAGTNAIITVNAGAGLSGGGTVALGGTIALTNTGWQLTGNSGTTAGVNFLGTTDNQPLEFKVNSQRALRLEPNASGAPNVVCGASVNYVISAVGVVIGGGGATNYSGVTYNNTVASDFGVISGGRQNVIQGAALDSTIGGGYINAIQTSAFQATIGGGSQNTIQLGANDATIGGGYNNLIQPYANYSTIGGGNNNRIQTNASDSAIGGGVQNTIQINAVDSAIGGGYNNTIQTNASYSTIGGGLQNTIQAQVTVGTIGGGYQNTIQPNANDATIAGGQQNTIQMSATNSTVAGGYANTIQTNSYDSTIAGGRQNIIQANAGSSLIGGGLQNTIQTNAYGSVIGGGFQNVIQTNAYQSTIAGGYQNTIQTYAYYSTIGGGDNNAIGYLAAQSTIGGGINNSIGANASAATISGGYNNTNTGSFAVVPGGSYNAATAAYGFAAGTHAKAVHQGAFVWADSQLVNFSSTANDQFLIRAQGGVGINKNNPAAALDVNGTVSAGAVGIGTATPAANLDVVLQQAYARLYSTNANFGSVLELRNDAPSAALVGAINFTVNGGGVPGQISYKQSDGSMHFRAGNLDNVMVITNNGIVGNFYGVFNGTLNGTVNSPSDRNIKEHFQPVDAQDVLAKVSAMSVTRWNYKQDKTSEHIGPMAQDFYSAFAVGPDDKHITTIDEAGVALAAIQGLNEKLEARVRQKEAEISDLKTRLEKLEHLITSRTAESH